MSSAGPDSSPWASKQRAFRDDARREAYASAKEEETAKLTARVQQLTALLVPALLSHSSHNLDSLVDLHLALDLHPSDVSSSAILSRLDKMSEESTSLEIDFLKARRAVSVLAKELLDIEVLQKDATSLETSLAAARPSASAGLLDASVMTKKAEEYERELAALQKAHAKSVAPDISLLIERNQVLEELVVANAKLKKEVAQYEGMPSDYDLAKLAVEEERRKLRERQAVRDEAMAAALS